MFTLSNKIENYINIFGQLVGFFSNIENFKTEEDFLSGVEEAGLAFFDDDWEVEKERLGWVEILWAEDTEEDWEDFSSCPLLHQTEVKPGLRKVWSVDIF